MLFPATLIINFPAKQRICPSAHPDLWIRVVDAGLVHPDGVARHDPVLVAGHRGEHAVPPLEGGLVGDAAQLGRALDGDVVSHEPDEEDPGGEGLSAVLEDGADEGGEPPAAGAASPSRDPGRGGPVPPGAARAATRALRVRPIGRGGLGKRADADLIAAAPLVDGFSEQHELVGGKARHERPEGVRSSHMDLSHPPERPPGGIVAKQTRAKGRLASAAHPARCSASASTSTCARTSSRSSAATASPARRA